MRREVYFNLNKHVYSIRAKGHSVSYAYTVRVENPTFVVRAGGRATVLRDRQKNVHAFLKGEMKTLDEVPSIEGLRQVKYDPYKAGYFFDVLTLEPVHEAEYAILVLTDDSRPRVYVKG